MSHFKKQKYICSYQTDLPMILKKTAITIVEEGLWTIYVSGDRSKSEFLKIFLKASFFLFANVLLSGWMCCLLFPVEGEGISRRSEWSFLCGSLFIMLWWCCQFAEAGEHHLLGLTRLSLGMLNTCIRNGPEPINVPLKSLHPCLTLRVLVEEMEEGKKLKRKPSRHYN